MSPPTTRTQYGLQSIAFLTANGEGVFAFVIPRELRRWVITVFTKRNRWMLNIRYIIPVRNLKPRYFKIYFYLCAQAQILHDISSYQNFKPRL
jgi:hypothetical protein